MNEAFARPTAEEVARMRTAADEGRVPRRSLAEIRKRMRARIADLPAQEDDPGSQDELEAVVRSTSALRAAANRELL